MIKTKTTAVLFLVLLALGLTLVSLFLGEDTVKAFGIKKLPAQEGVVPAPVNSALLPLALAAPVDSLDPATNGRTRRPARTKIEKGHGCVSGRVIVDGQPVKGVTILSYKTISDRVIQGKVKATEEQPAPELPRGMQEGLEQFVSSTEGGGVSDLDGTETDEAGRFRICAEPGPLILLATITAKATTRVQVTVLEGEEVDLGDLAIQLRSDSFSAVLKGPPEQGAISVHAGYAGLRITTTFEGEVRSKRRSTTGRDGEGSFSWTDSRAIRIDLVDKNGFTLGSTDFFQAYPPNGRSELFITATPGTLKMHLPDGVRAGSREFYQFHLIRTDSPELDIRVQSISGKRIPLAERGYRTSPECLEYQALRPGAYEVKALKHVQSEDGQSFAKHGEWLRTTAYVFPGQVTHCTLE